MQVDPTNTAQAEAWDGGEGSYWAANAERYDRAVARYHRRLLDAAAIVPGERVLDVGCGSGQTTRDAARLAGAEAGGSALGVDLSAVMLDVARSRAARDGITNVEFLQADAQIHPFERASFDAVISRTGAMFFGDRAAAFTNLAGALKPEGRLALLAWQPFDRNEWVRSFFGALVAGRDMSPPPPDAPGPFALSDPAVVEKLLLTTGFAEPAFEALAEPLWFGHDADDALTFVVGQLGWMLEGLDDEARAGALDALRANLADHESTDGDGVTYASAAWLITAVRASA